jgi:predicted transcriptional regulator YdeE
LLGYVDDPARPLPKAESDALIQAHLQYDQGLQRDGKWVEAGALQPARAGRTVQVRDGKVSVTDGPYAETKEELGGFYVIEARDLDEAVQIAAGIPSARHGWVEVRPFRQLFDDLNPPPPRPAAKAGPPGPPRIARASVLTLAGFAARYTPETMPRIPAQWGKFGSQVGQVTGPIGPASFGLAYPWKDGWMDYFTSIQATAGARVPEGWQLLSLPAHRYAVFAHEGHVSTMSAAIEWILSRWLPASGHRASADLAGGAVILERYGAGFDPRTGHGDIELWVPLEGEG